MTFSYYIFAYFFPIFMFLILSFRRYNQVCLLRFHLFLRLISKFLDLIHILSCLILLSLLETFFFNVFLKFLIWINSFLISYITNLLPFLSIMRFHCRHGRLYSNTTRNSYQMYIRMEISNRYLIHDFHWIIQYPSLMRPFSWICWSAQEHQY